MAEAFLPAGSPAPPFQLKAVTSERIIGPGLTGNRALVLLFHDQTMVGVVREVNTTVREHYAADRVLVASAVDLRAVPGLLRGVVSAFMRQAYRQGAAALPPAADPADYVIILPDWDGAAARALRVPPLRLGASVVVLDPDGIVAGSEGGGGLGAAALSILDRMTFNGS
jgi:hypothetical protein